jgi:hypothetical protein
MTGRQAFWISVVLMVIVGLFNLGTTGDIDGHPGEHCLVNPRTNDEACFPDRRTSHRVFQ